MAGDFYMNRSNTQEGRNMLNENIQAS